MSLDSAIGDDLDWTLNMLRPCRPPSFVLLTVAGLAVASTGCTGGAGRGHMNVSTDRSGASIASGNDLAAAYGKTLMKDSFRFTLVVGDSPTETPRRFEGVADAVHHAAEFVSKDVNGGTSEFRFVDGFTYVHSPVTAGPGQSWQRVPSPNGQDGIARVRGLLPAPDEVASLTGDDGGLPAEELGAEDIHGVSTTHYQLRVDPSAVARQLAKSPSVARNFAGAALQIQLWIDAEGLVRELQLRFYHGPASPTAGSLAPGLLGSLTLDLSDFNQTPAIVAPPSDEVVAVSP